MVVQHRFAAKIISQIREGNSNCHSKRKSLQLAMTSGGIGSDRRYSLQDGL